MDLPWKVRWMPMHASPEAASPVHVAEFGWLTQGLFESACRIYTIRNESGVAETRAGHRHPPGGKLEALFCLQGEMTVRLHHPLLCGTVRMSHPRMALVIGSDVWHEITLEPQAILLSAASTVYAPGESIADRLCRCP